MKQTSGLIGWQSTSRNDVVKQLPSRYIFHDHKDIRGSINHLVPICWYMQSLCKFIFTSHTEIYKLSEIRRHLKILLTIQTTKNLDQNFHLQSDYMRMSTHFENIDLSPDLLSHFHVFYLSLVQNLDGNFLASDNMTCHLNQRRRKIQPF